MAHWHNGAILIFRACSSRPKYQPPQVVSIPVTGGTPQTLLSGFVAPIVGLGINNDRLYVGELTGDVYSVRLQP